MNRSYEEMKNELEKLENEDEQVFKQVKEAKEHMCDQHNKQCMFIVSKEMDCLKCDYYLNTIKPLEDRSLQLLVEITNLQKEINDYAEVN